jgi:hypothetical protein
VGDARRKDKKRASQKRATEQQHYEVRKVGDWSGRGGKPLCDDLSLAEPIGEGDSMLNIYKLFFPLFTRFSTVGHRIQL